MSEAKHTPTPWTMTIDGKSQDYTISGADGEMVANDTTYYPSAPLVVDAVFIVKAVNNHDDLLAALKRCEAMVSTDQGPPDWDWVREVISKAEATP